MAHIAHRAIAAARPQAKYIPAFTVLRLEGTYTKTVAKMVPISDRKDRHGNQRMKLVYETVEVPRGFLVASPKNGSVHLDSYEKLEEWGFTDTEVPLVDDDGEGVGSVPNHIRRAKAKETVTNA
jgi:hypothetical protein